MSGELVSVVRKYRELDDQIKELNAHVFKLREHRKIAEIQLADILKQRDYTHLTKLEIKDDGSFIKIQRPEGWSKPWSLSAKELQTLLGSYFAVAGHPSAEECFRFVVAERKKNSVAREFSFTRLTSSKEQDEE
jgi:hypothetical protein